MLCREAGKGLEKGMRPTAGTALTLSGRPALNSAARRYMHLCLQEPSKPATVQVGEDTRGTAVGPSRAERTRGPHTKLCPTRPHLSNPRGRDFGQSLIPKPGAKDQG